MLHPAAAGCHFDRSSGLQGGPEEAFPEQLAWRLDARQRHVSEPSSFCVSRSEEEGLRMGLYRPWPNKENDSVMYSLLMQF